MLGTLYSPFTDYETRFPAANPPHPPYGPPTTIKGTRISEHVNQALVRGVPPSWRRPLAAAQMEG